MPLKTLRAKSARNHIGIVHMVFTDLKNKLSLFSTQTVQLQLPKYFMRDPKYQLNLEVFPWALKAWAPKAQAHRLQCLLAASPGFSGSKAVLWGALIPKSSQLALVTSGHLCKQCQHNRKRMPDICLCSTAQGTCLYPKFIIPIYLGWFTQLVHISIYLFPYNMCSLISKTCQASHNQCCD